jgi:hypothetical protein
VFSTNAKKSNVEVPLTELYEYFKNINSSDEEYEQNNDTNNYNIQFGLEISNRMLNCSITDTEIGLARFIFLRVTLVLYVLYVFLAS